MNQSGICGCRASPRPQGLRNAARIYVRAGAPMDRNVLVTTCPSPSAYIEGDTFNRATKTNAAISR